jgi:hypothetical protein
LQQHKQLQLQPQGTRVRPLVSFPPSVAPRPHHPTAAAHPFKPQAAARSSGPGASTAAAGSQQPRQQGSEPSATKAAVAADTDDGNGWQSEAHARGLGAVDAAGLLLGGATQAELLLAQMEAQEERVQAGVAGVDAGGGPHVSDDDDEALATLADFCGQEEGVEQLEVQEELAEEEEWAAEVEAGRAGESGRAAVAKVGGKDDAPIVIDDDSGCDPVPALPRAVCGLFAGAHGLTAGPAGAGGGGGKAPGGKAASGMAAVPSFAKKVGDCLLRKHAAARVAWR